MLGTENLNVGRHVVQFYGHDKELAERVTGYLLGALEGGGVAIVIATPEHRGEFETRLEQAGVDLAAARDDGAYLALDAARTLQELMPAGQLDQDAFDRVIGTLIRGRGGRTAGPRLRRAGRAALGRRAGQRRGPARGAVGRTGPQASVLPVLRLPGRLGDPRHRRLRRGVPPARGDRRRPTGHRPAVRLLPRGARGGPSLRRGHAERLGGRRPRRRRRPGGDRTRRQRHRARRSAFTVILSARDDLLRISVRDAARWTARGGAPPRCTAWGRWTRWPAGGE